MTYSYSKLKKYDMCNFMFKKMYIDGVKTEGNEAMELGSALHEAIYFYNRTCIEEGREEVFEKWEECLMKALDKYNLSKDKETEAREIMKAYAESHEIDIEGVAGIEERMALDKDLNPVIINSEEDWQRDDILFRAVVDKLQITGMACRITDYKSGWAKADPFQNMIYAWIVSKYYPHIEVFQGALDYIRSEYIDDSYEWNKDDLKRVETKVLNKIKAIESGAEFLPKACAACDDCGCWAWCPLMKDVPDLGLIRVPKNEEEAVGLAEQIITLDKRKREKVRLIKTYCKNADLIGGGKQWGFKASLSWKFPMRELIIAMNEENVSPDEYLKVDTAKINKLMGGGRIANKLKDIGKKSVRVSFSSTKEDTNEES